MKQTKAKDNSTPQPQPTDGRQKVPPANQNPKQNEPQDDTDPYWNS